MRNEERTTRRYSVSFRLMVVTELEKGVTIGYLQRKYGINGGETIQNWVRSFGKNHLLNKVVRIETMGEKDRIKELERQLKEAKLALADATMEKRFYEILVEEANKEFKTDLKKNFGKSSSPEPPKSTT
jgi:transposase-like protein